MLYTSRRAVKHVLRLAFLQKPSTSSRQFHASLIASMKEKRIVSSFICRKLHGREGSEGLQIALFKRSNNVSTYKQKWAVCSGSIDSSDPTPEYAARREIEEETQLTSDDITLFRTGHPFRLDDEGLGITWIIHEFAFLMDDPAKELIIEGEHTEYKFIDPQDLTKNDTVPALDVSLRSLFPGPETERGLQALKNDHDHGAEALGGLALGTLRNAIHGEDLQGSQTPEEFWRDLRLVAWILAKNGRPDMGPAIEGALFSAISDIANVIEKQGKSVYEAGGLEGLPIKGFKEMALDSIDETIAMRKARMGVVSLSCLDYISDSEAGKRALATKGTINILTLSYSSSVTRGIKEVISDASRAGVRINLRVLESRPRFDGIAFVKDILSSNFAGGGGGEKIDLSLLNISIISDASVAFAARDADFVLIGSDKISADGDVSNKIGSLPACVIAKTLRPECKVVVVATTDKITSEVVDERAPVDYAPAEITAAYPLELAAVVMDGGLHGAKVEVKNVYFEWVPAKWIDVYVTEAGHVDRGALRKYADEKKTLEEKLFSDL